MDDITAGASMLFYAGFEQINENKSVNKRWTQLKGNFKWVSNKSLLLWLKRT
jgi:hypothetical protein